MVHAGSALGSKAVYLAVRPTTRVDRGDRERIAAQTALGRVGLADDIGPAVAALLSPGFDWVTGQRIEFSAGQNL